MHTKTKTESHDRNFRGLTSNRTFVGMHQMTNTFHFAFHFLLLFFIHLRFLTGIKNPRTQNIDPQQMEQTTRNLNQKTHNKERKKTMKSVCPRIINMKLDF